MSKLLAYLLGGGSDQSPAASNVISPAEPQESSGHPITNQSEAQPLLTCSSDTEDEDGGLKTVPTTPRSSIDAEDQSSCAKVVHLPPPPVRTGVSDDENHLDEEAIPLPPSHYAAAAATPAAPPADDAEAAKARDEAEARESVKAQIEFLNQIKIHYESSLTHLQTASRRLPSGSLHKTSGAHIVQDKINAAREATKALEAKLVSNVHSIDEQLSQLTPLISFQDNIALPPEESPSQVLRYIKIGSGALLITTVFLSTSGLASGIYLASLYNSGISASTIWAGFTGIPTVALGLGGGVGGTLVGGAATVVLNRAIEVEGGLKAFTEQLQAEKLRLHKEREALDKEVSNAIAAVDAAYEGNEALSRIISQDMLAIPPLLADKTKEGVGRAAQWLKGRAAFYKHEDYATAILAYSMVNPQGAFRDESPLDNNPLESIKTVAEWLYKNKPAKKLDFLFNMALYFMTLHYGRTAELDKSEYVIWKEIADSAGFPTLIAFDLELARRGEIEDKSALPTIAMKMKEIQIAKEQGYVKSYADTHIVEAYLDSMDLDSMAKKDAVNILQSTPSDIQALIARTIEIYNAIFSEASAKKYAATLLLTAAAPHNNLNAIDEAKPTSLLNQEQIEQCGSILYAAPTLKHVTGVEVDGIKLTALDKIARDHVDISAIMHRLYPSDHSRQNELIYELAKQLMQAYCPGEVGSPAYSANFQVHLNEFVKHPVTIHCAKILNKDPSVFASEIASVPNPLVIYVPPRVASPEAISPIALDSSFFDGTGFLDGGDYASRKLGEVGGVGGEAKE